jgi:hypothetical protein
MPIVISKNVESKHMSSGTVVRNQLVCPHCGNKNRFFQVMAEEVHLVDGNLNYIRLLESTVDHYVCEECSTSIEANGCSEK